MRTNFRIAIPLSEGKLSKHFGHLDCVALADVNPVEKQVIRFEEIQVPPLQPGRISFWLAELNTNLIIAGDMGKRAQEQFEEHGIKIIVGAQPESPEKLVTEYLLGTLEIGDNRCSH